jgi:hypothetical protein
MKNDVTTAPAVAKRSTTVARPSGKRQRSSTRDTVLQPRETARNARDTVLDAKPLVMDTLLDLAPLRQDEHSRPTRDMATIDNDATQYDGNYEDAIREHIETLAKRKRSRRITGNTAAGLTHLARQRFAKQPTVTVMSPLHKPSLAKRLLGQKPVSRIVMAVVAVCVVAHPTTRAVAEGIVHEWRHPAPTSVLTDPRDPKDFVADLAIVMPRPTVVLTRQDAVAQELLKYSRTMSTQDVLRTAQAINEEAERLGYDPLLLLALIHIESFYDHLALSPVGAEGLMQLMPPTAEWMAGRLQLQWNEGHTFDPVLNVRLGSQYLAYLHREFGRMDYALTAYNRGPQATRYLVDRFGSLPVPIYDFYAGRVLGYYEKLKAMYGKLPMG